MAKKAVGKKVRLKSQIERTTEEHYSVETKAGTIEHHFSRDGWHQLRHLRSGMANAWTPFQFASILEIGDRTFGGFTSYGLVANLQECVIEMTTQKRKKESLEGM